MRATGLGAILAAAITLAAVAPAPAAAAADYYAVPAGHATRFQIEGTNGYRVRVSVNDRRHFRLKTLGHGVASEYAIRAGRTGRYGIDAKLAGLGVVDVAFVPSGRARRLGPFPTCDGAGPRVEEGHVRGRIRFRGEGGYTSVSARRIRAQVVSWSRQRCRYLEPGNERRPRKRVATFSAFSPSGSVDFRAARFSPRFRPPAGRVSFTAYIGSRQGRLSIFRRAYATAPVSSFLRPDPKAEPEHVVLTPPAPFTGTASFQRTPESTFSWTGSLAVEIPGLPPLPLTGPEYETSFCILRACADQSAAGSSAVPLGLWGGR